MQNLPVGFQLSRFPSTLELNYHGQFVAGWPLPYQGISENEWKKEILEAIKSFKEKNHAEIHAG